MTSFFASTQVIKSQVSTGFFSISLVPLPKKQLRIFLLFQIFKTKIVKANMSNQNKKSFQSTSKLFSVSKSQQPKSDLRDFLNEKRSQESDAPMISTRTTPAT